MNKHRYSLQKALAPLTRVQYWNTISNHGKIFQLLVWIDLKKQGAIPEFPTLWSGHFFHKVTKVVVSWISWISTDTFLKNISTFDKTNKMKYDIKSWENLQYSHTAYLFSKIWRNFGMHGTLLRLCQFVKIHVLYSEGSIMHRVCLFFTC